MKKYYLIFFLMILLSFPIFVEAQRGCCSHHGGVYGCHKSGRTLCMDGTLSPTCTCVVPSKYTYGCTDPDTKNYNAKANKDNGMCIYYEYGCTDTDAINYDYYAEIDDGSCEYEKKEDKSLVAMFFSSIIYFFSELFYVMFSQNIKNIFGLYCF